MENKMPLVHHIVKWWGCSCIIEDVKGLNEKDPRTSNYETHVQANVGGLGTMEGIELG
jgi:hypothetical protein